MMIDTTTCTIDDGALCTTALAPSDDCCMTAADAAFFCGADDHLAEAGGVWIFSLEAWTLHDEVVARTAARGRA